MTESLNQMKATVHSMKLKDAVNRTTMRKVERENGELKEKLDTLGKQPTRTTATIV